MSSSSAAAMRPPETMGLKFVARVMTGPLPKACSPCSFLGTPGVSVAWVTSTAMAASGSSPKAAPRPIKTYLLLHARYRDDLRRQAVLLREQPQSLQNYEGAHAVVQ